MTKEILVLYTNGVSINKISSMVRMGSRRIRKILVKNQVSIRSIAEQKKIHRRGEESLCHMCESTIYRKPNKGRRNKRHFCSRRCYALFLKYAMRGSNNHQWRGGRSIAEMIRGSPRSREWIRFVLERDDFTCQQCKKRGVHLHAHHIVPFSRILSLFLEQHSLDNLEVLLSVSQEYEEFFDPDNGVSLCVECHKGIHYS